MIKTERQYATTRTQVEKLATALQDVSRACETPPAGVDPRFLDLERKALESQLADLRAEVEEYEALRASGALVIPATSLADLPRALIQARIARGWTQADLADRLGLAEQQIQRYEATEYESASFARLREIAKALDVQVPSAVLGNETTVSPQYFFRRLKEVGFDREVVLHKVLPADVAETLQSTARQAETPPVSDAIRAAVARAGALVSRVLDLDVAAFFSTMPLRLEAAVAGGPRYKQTTAQAARERQERLRNGTSRTDAYTVYAHYLALLLLDAHAHLPAKNVPDDPRVVRHTLTERYANHGGVSLEGTLHFAWDLGIPVLPLADSGRFHGACWRVDGRNVIVLKQQTRSLARWMFDLLHELRHAGQHPTAQDFTVVELEPGADDSDNESDAMTFAGDVLLDGRAEAITERAVAAARGSVEQLKLVVPDVAAREGVSTDALANYLAHRLALQGINWWGAANNLQPPGADPFAVARDVLLERADLSRINPVDRQLVLGALQTAA